MTVFWSSGDKKNFFSGDAKCLAVPERLPVSDVDLPSSSPLSAKIRNNKQALAQKKRFKQYSARGNKQTLNKQLPNAWLCQTLTHHHYDDAKVTRQVSAKHTALAQRKRFKHYSASDTGRHFGICGSPARLMTNERVYQTHVDAAAAPSSTSTVPLVTNGD